MCGQLRFRVRMVWGSSGAMAAVGRGGIAVVVDVLSFTTALNVATDRGTVVYPYAFGEKSAVDFARRHDAELAVGRRQVTAADQVSLSPASILSASAKERLVLPSPNGSAISLQLAEAGALVVAAGERWRDGSLRPAVEDLWGAGAVLAGLSTDGCSPEAGTAAAAFRAVESSLESVLLGCVSGQELAAAGFVEDVRIAGRLDVSDGVPMLEDGRFAVHRS